MREDLDEAATRAHSVIAVNSELLALPAHLKDDEKVLCVAAVTYETRLGLLAVTDKRIVFYPGDTGPWAIPAQTMTVTLDATAQSSTIGITCPGVHVVLTNIDNQDAATVATILRGRGVGPAGAPPEPPGFFDKIRKKRAQRAFTTAMVEWQGREAHLAQLCEEAEHYRGASVAGFLTKAGENPLMQITGAGLVEAVRGQGHFVAGSQGLSFRVAKGVRYRVGATRGHYVPGDEAPGVIDTGTAVITDQRIVFSGLKQSREWSYDKLLSYTHAKDWTALPVSNRQKTSGIKYGAPLADRVAFMLELGLAMHSGQVDAFTAGIRADYAALLAQRPAPPP